MLVYVCVGSVGGVWICESVRLCRECVFVWQVCVGPVCVCLSVYVCVYVCVLRGINYKT